MAADGRAEGATILADGREARRNDELWAASLTQELFGGRASTDDFKTRWYELVVLGNGFDLECGLSSSFRSFVDDRKAFFDGKPQLPAGAPAYTRTIWDSLLDGLATRHGDPLWCNVEDAIAEWLVPRHGEPTIDRTLSLLGATPRATGTGDEFQLSTGQADAAERAVARQLRERFPLPPGDWDRQRLLAITHQDLSAYERDFSAYLDYQVDATEGYQDRANLLLRQLLLQETPDEDSYDLSAGVLSFNYTRPAEPPALSGHETVYVNIHGNLGSEIVFGVDGTEIMGEPDILPFTKTYRLMAFDLPDIEGLIHTPSPRPLLDRGTALIKFYGHSLGTADYAYFQAIFDAVNLYGGTTRLVFYYRPHDDWTDEFARAYTMDAVIRLLVSYGMTLDNRDHGKNLIHKLLIEGRLSVRRLGDE